MLRKVYLEGTLGSKFIPSFEVEAETLQDKSSESMNYIEKSKLYLLAFALFVRDDKNVIYLGIICIILSIIIYFFNITTS